MKNALGIILSMSLSVGLVGCDNHGYLYGKPPVPKDEQKVKGKAFNPKIDILFVIDDSGSMDPHQTQLAANISLFTNEIFKSKTLDFHIGVLTTSADGFSNPGPGKNGVLNGNNNTKVIDKNTPNGVRELERNLLVGINGSGSEAMFDPVYLALTAPNLTGANAGFYRQDAYLAVIFITDAEDQSTRMRKPIDFYNFLLNLKGGSREKVLAYGAIVPVNDRTNCQRDDGSMKPQRVEEFFQLAGASFGTSFYSLCDLQYGKKLSGVGADIIMKTGRFMYLDRRPIVETIRVTFGRQVVPSDPRIGWTFNPVRNAIELGEDIVWTPQPPGTAVEVTFDPVIEDEP